MYHYNYEVLISDRQKQVEKVSNEAWKYKDLKRDSLFTRILNKFASKKSTNNCVTCEC
jgi:hypothetical protein